MKYCILLRKTEYYQNNNKRVRAFFYQMLLRRKQIRYGILIPPNTCGIGLSIAHLGPIIINDKCTVGENCRIHVGVVLGANGGNPPRIGSNVYIGPGAKVFGDICVADGVSIGANAVVNHDCTEKNGIYVGIPAKLVRVKEK